MPVENVYKLYPLFDEAEGTMLFRPTWPVTPQPTYISLDQIATFIGSGGISAVTVTTTTVLANDFAGYLWVDNTTGNPVTITLPATPIANQRVVVKDSTGTAGTDAITVAGGGGKLIEGDATVDLVEDYAGLDLIYSGVQWVRVP